MPIPFPAAVRHHFTRALAAAFCLSLAACGGGGTGGDDLAEPLAQPQHDGTRSIAAVATSHTLHVAIKIPGHPHAVDVYQPAGATRAIVFLHGRGGRTGLLAYEFGFNRAKTAPTAKNVEWDWLARHGIIAVFPQGQIPSGSTLSTWSNYIQDSGQDDVAFLHALSSHVKAQYGATEVSLAGHSNGGAMTARMWCESTPSYKAYVTLAGPMPSATHPIPSGTCTPLAPAPYHAVVGGNDSTLAKFALGNAVPTPEQIAAGLDDMVLVSEWIRHQDRSRAICGEMPALEGSSIAASGPTWNACDSRIRYTVVTDAEHPIASIEQHAGTRMADLIAAFVQ